MADLNTTMKSAQNVYSGPGTSYVKIGSVSKDEQVTAKFTEAASSTNYCYIQYTITGTNDQKCGYVLASGVNLDPSVLPFTPSYGDRWVMTTAHSKWGPGSNFVDARPLPRGLTVSYTNKKIDNYALVEFTVSGEKYRAFFYANNLSSTAVTTTTIEKMVAIAGLDVGYAETNDNITKFGEWIGMNGQAWCASFVSWCAAFANNAQSTLPIGAGKFYKTASVSAMKSAFGASRLSTTPGVGDAAFFSSSSHVGLVVTVSANSIEVIEGNASDAVRKTTYTKNAQGNYVNGSSIIDIFGR